eukprot:1160542-Pelagomonas_calceolata.AAC.5
MAGSSPCQIQHRLRAHGFSGSSSAVMVPKHCLCSLSLVCCPSRASAPSGLYHVPKCNCFTYIAANLGASNIEM